MLKKLIKYDFKSVFKLWWIAAASTVALSVIGGLIASFFAADEFTEKVIPIPILIVAVIILTIVFIGFGAFGIFTDILVYVRYYKNLFTDEGYLTFTLPAKRKTILNSKILLSFVFGSLTGLVLTINTVNILLISCGKYIFTKEILEEIKYVIKEILAYEYSYYFAIYLIEFIVIGALLLLTSYLFTFGCITVASVIAKKAKILVAVGIYYGAVSILSSILSLFYLFGISSLYEVFWALDQSDVFICVALLLVIVALVLCATCCLLYYLLHWCLHKKLNLA